MNDHSHPEAERLRLTVTVDGHTHESEVDPGASLAEVLRDDLGVRSVRIGCANGDCGACTARVEGACLKTCLVLAHRAQGAHVTTMAGMGAPSAPSVVQEAFVEHFAFQCGFCLPGMLMSAQDLLDRNADPDESEIRDALSGNVCRCTGYTNAVRAVRMAARTLNDPREEAQP